MESQTAAKQHQKKKKYSKWNHSFVPAVIVTKAVEPKDYPLSNLKDLKKTFRKDVKERMALRDMKESNKLLRKEAYGALFYKKHINPPSSMIQLTD